MKGLKHFSYSGSRPLILFGGLLILVFLQACSTYSSSRGYSTGGHSYQGSSHYPGYDYYSHRSYSRSYYGNYQPGWFITAGYPGSYYGAPFAYWPSYSYAYYRNAYYPYHDPWYYSYSNHYRNNRYRHPYGYGYGAGYRFGYPYYRYSNRPYYGNTHSYRPPGNTQPPADSRPDPVVIPPGQRGRRGASDEFNERVDEAIRQRETHQPGRRSVTVVNEEQDMSRSVGLAPTQAGDQGMTISSRDERKVRESRLEPVEAPTIVQPNGAQNNSRRAYSTQPVQQSAPPIQVRSGRSSRSYQSPTETVRTAPAPQHRTVMPRQQPAPVAVPQARSEPVYRQAPARTEPPSQPQPPPRSAPVYQQQLDSSNVIPRVDRRQSRDTVRERQRQNR